MEGNGGDSSPESGITEIAKTTDPTSTSSEQESCGGGAPGFAPDGKVEEGEADAGCDHGKTTEIPRPPQLDGINDSMKHEDKVVQHADAAVAPVASTSFKRTYSGGTGSSSSRRTAQKRVVTVPISEIGDGVPRPRSGSSGAAAGEGAPPPSDSWTWRKYGQKPIKGSPYPRGYYRCSSSKGCPARKQVERSRADPNMLVVTYASDHNHPWPVPRNGAHHHVSRQSAAAQPYSAGSGAGPAPHATNPLPSSSTDEEDMEVDYEIAPVVKEEEIAEEKILLPSQQVRIQTTTSLTTNSSTDKATTSSPSLDTTSSADNSLSGASDDSGATLIPPMPTDGVDDLCSTWFPVVDDEISLCSATADTAAKIMIPFSYDDLRADLMGSNRPSGGGCGAEDDDDSLFAGLGELPEFSLVFRRGILDADFTRGW